MHRQSFVRVIAVCGALGLALALAGPVLAEQPSSPLDQTISDVKAKWPALKHANAWRSADAHRCR